MADPIGQNPFLRPTVSAAAPMDNPFIVKEEANPFLTKVKSAEKVPYTQNDLVKDEYFNPIADYMSMRNAYTREEMDQDREKIVDEFLNNRRGMAAGNSYRAVSEVAFLNNIKDDEELAKVGKAYKIFEDMESIGSDEATWGETLEGVQDYTRTIILDPVNALSLIGGKFLATGTTKVATRVAQKTAMDAYNRSLGKAISQGVGREAAEKVAKASADKVFSQAITSNNAKLSAQFGVNRASLQASKNTLEKLTTTQSVKAILGSTAIESIFSTGAEFAYQEGLVRTGVREGYDKYALGIAALGGLLVGGAQAGYIGLKGSSKLALPSIDVVPPNSKNVSKRLMGAISQRVQVGDWSAKVGRGKELEDLDSQLFIDFLLGDEKKGIEGLTSILLTEGFTFQKATPEDKFTNWLTDIMVQFEPKDAEDFMDAFQKATGVKMPQAANAATNIKTFADTLARKISDQGRVLNAASQGARKLGIKDTKDLTYSQYAESMLSMGLRAAEESPSWLMKKLQPFGLEGIQSFQNNVIRGIVSNLGTSRLNVAGWAAATGMNSFTDISMAALHSGWSGAKLLQGDLIGSREGIRLATQLVNANKQKVRNLLDPDTTYESFMSLSIKRPEALKKLMDVTSGGTEMGAKSFGGFDPNKTLLGSKVDESVDFLQLVSLAKAQDVFTKSQEFVYQLDKNLRVSFDKGWSEFFNDPNANKLMASEDYVKAESKAVYETLRAIYSKSYKGPGPLGEAAAVIEDFRNIPVVGFLMPFGRFFNNTVHTMADGSGLSFVLKAAGLNKERPAAELLIRAAASWTVVGALVSGESKYRDEGLGMFEGRDPITGVVADYRYEFPYSIYKGVARIASYMNDGVEIPPTLLRQFGEIALGQLTRQLTEAQDGLIRTVEGLSTGDLEFGEAFGRFVKSLVAPVTAAGTRAFEPVNDLVGLMRGVDYASIDKRQGSKMLNESLRYLDQMVGATVGDLAPQKYSTASEPPRPSMTKYVGLREATPPTALKKLFNIAGYREFERNAGAIYSEAEASDNRYNQLFNTLVERDAEKLLTSETFKKGSVEAKRIFVSELIRDTAKTVKDVMKSNVVETGDRRLNLMMKIANARTEGAISKALKDLSEQTFKGQDLKFDDLTEQQLEILDIYFDTREKFLKR